MQEREASRLLDQEHARLTELHDIEVDTSLVDELDTALASVAHAYERFESREYGTCERCGRPISDERLRAVPAATLCIDHERERERGVGS